MRLRYDQQVDVLYLQIARSKIVESGEVRPGIIIDFGAKSEVVGVEILDLRRRLRKPDLKQIKALLS